MKVWRRISKAYSPVEMYCMYMIWWILYQRKQKTAGRNAAEYVKNLQSDTDDEEKSSKEDTADITLNPVEGVRYTVPSTINPAHMDENLTVRFPCRRCI